MPVARDILRQTATTAATTLTIQLSTFLVLAAAPLVLSNGDFADLAVIVATTMLANAFFDLGLNLTSTKFFGDSQDESWFLAAFRIRLMCLPLAGALALVLSLAISQTEIGVGLVCGGFLNLWNGIRATDQARQDYLSFSRISVIFAGLRVSCGVAALFFMRDPVAIALGLYIFPVFAGLLSSSWRLVRGALQHPGQKIRQMLGYAFHVYLNALVFTGLPYVPQLIIADRFDDLAAGTYGLIITFTAPVSLVIYSLRAVLLPKMLGGAREIEDIMWSPKGGGVIAIIALIFIAGGGFVALALDLAYGVRFPGIRDSFMIFFIGFAITSAVGFYSLSVHTLGVPHVAMWIALGKAVFLAILLGLFGQSLNQVIAITSVTMIGGELVLAILLFHTRWRSIS